VKILVSTGQLLAGKSCDLDFDHQFIETEKYDAMKTYKKFTGYSPGVAVIGDLIVGIENRDGNATCVSTSRTRWSASSQISSLTTSTLGVPGWTAAPARVRLWRP